MSNLKVQVFADGADIEEMKQAYQNKEVDGFTTNPSLMKKAGVTFGSYAWLIPIIHEHSQI